MGLFSIEQRRLRGDIEVYKPGGMNGIDSKNLIPMVGFSKTRGHRYKGYGDL